MEKVTEEDIDLSIVYIKVINGQDIIATIDYNNLIDNTINEYLCLYPTQVISDYDGIVDPDDIFLEDWLPINEDKAIYLTTSKILDIMLPTEHAVDRYRKFIKRFIQDSKDEEEKTNIVSLISGQRPNP